jgi:hypothetical protein
MTASELFLAMSPKLANQILEELHANDRDLYRVALQATAQARKVRPVFLERQPRAERHRTMIGAFCRSDMTTVAGNVLSGWLVKTQPALLTDFLDTLKIKHDKGVVEDLPKTVDDAELSKAIDLLVGKYPREIVALYLHAFYGMNEASWPKLDAMLHEDERLVLGRD